MLTLGGGALPAAGVSLPPPQAASRNRAVIAVSRMRSMVALRSGCVEQGLISLRRETANNVTQRTGKRMGDGAAHCSKIGLEFYQCGVVTPTDEVAKVNMSILLEHGHVDQRVRTRQASMSLAEPKKSGKPYKYVELEGADHLCDTLFHALQIKLDDSIIDFLKSDCGPGGLQARIAKRFRRRMTRQSSGRKRSWSGCTPSFLTGCLTCAAGD